MAPRGATFPKKEGVARTQDRDWATRELEQYHFQVSHLAVSAHQLHIFVAGTLDSRDDVGTAVTVVIGDTV